MSIHVQEQLVPRGQGAQALRAGQLRGNRAGVSSLVLIPKQAATAANGTPASLILLRVAFIIKPSSP
jgi:hypothetical protein